MHLVRCPTPDGIRIHRQLRAFSGCDSHLSQHSLTREVWQLEGNTTLSPCAIPVPWGLLGNQSEHA